MTNTLKGYSVKHKNYLLEEVTTLQQAGKEIENAKALQENCRATLPVAETEEQKKVLRAQITQANIQLKNLYIHIQDLYDMNDIIKPEPAKATKSADKPKRTTTVYKGAKTVTEAKQAEITNPAELAGTRIWFKSRKGNIQRTLLEENGTQYVVAFGDTYILEHEVGLYFAVKLVHLNKEGIAS